MFKIFIGIVAILVLYVLFVRALAPRYFVTKHRVVYDLDDEQLHSEVVGRLKKYSICGANYSENELNCAVLTFYCPKWQSKKILKDLRQLKEVEVI